VSTGPPTWIDIPEVDDAVEQASDIGGVAEAVADGPAQPRRSGTAPPGRAGR
jgi:hypothetical protein